MSITICDHEFQGPFPEGFHLLDTSGVYVVLCLRSGVYTPIDCGESEEVGRRIAHHDRRNCWLKHSQGGDLLFAVSCCEEFTRMAVEVHIRSNFDLPCGER